MWGTDGKDDGRARSKLLVVLKQHYHGVKSASITKRNKVQKRIDVNKNNTERYTERSEV
jgi:hypothetical protein